MKKQIACLVLIALFISLLSPVFVSAADLPVWDPTATEQMVETNGNMSYDYLFQPVNSGKAAFITPVSSGLHVKLMPQNSNESIPVARIFRDDRYCFIADVTAGSTYTLNFFTIQDNGVAIPVTTKAWSESMFEFAPIGTNATQAVSGTNSYSYLVKVPSDGIYTLTFDSESTECFIGAYPYYLLEADLADKPLLLGTKNNGSQRVITYYLSAQKQYEMEIMGIREGASNVCSYSIIEGSPYGDSIGVLDSSSPLTVPFGTGENARRTYVVHAPTDGKYMLQHSAGLSAMMYDANGSYLAGEYFGSIYSENIGYVYELKAGQNYEISLENTASTSGNYQFSFVKYSKINSVSIEIVSYSYGNYTLLAKTDPASGVLEDIQWSVSDPSVFSVNATNEVAELQALKDGSAKVTVKIGDKTASMTIKSKPDAVTLSENKTAVCYPFDADSPAAYFKPAVSGTYQFTFEVKRNQSIRAIIADAEGYFLCDNRLQAKPVVSVDLEAGKEYRIFLEQTVCNITVVRTATANTPQSPTDGPQTPDSGETNTDTGNTQTQATQPPASNTPPESTEGTNKDEVATGGQTPETTPDTQETEPAGTDEPQTDKIHIEIIGDSAVLDTESVQQMLDKNPGQAVVIDVQNDDGIQSVTVAQNAWAAAYENGVPIAFKMNDGLGVHFTEASVSGIYQTAAGSDLVVRAQMLDMSRLNESQQKILGEFTVGAVVELSLSCNDQPIHELGGIAQVTIPCPDDSESWKVFYIRDDGSVEEMTVIDRAGNQITIETDHFSAFALVKDKMNDAPASGGGAGWIIAIVVVVVVLGGGAAAFFILKKKNMLPWLKSE